MLVFIYSGIFSAGGDKYPVPSFYERITGTSSPSHGLSKCFSEIIRGNLDSARRYNENGILIFSFFLVQLALRLAINITLVRRLLKPRLLLLLDVIFTILLFLFCFHNLISILVGSVF
jgi:hypothetical protein